MDTINKSDVEGLALGAEIAGGFYCGQINSGGALYALVAAPKDLEFASAWGEYGQNVEGATSYHDGAANTAAMLEAGSPPTKQLATGWHIPARDELELLYRAFKPSAEENYTYRSGENPSAAPPTYPYTEQLPAQTSAAAFKQGGDQALADTWYWSSTQYSATSAWSQYFGDGGQSSTAKSIEGRVRPVRRLIIQ